MHSPAHAGSCGAVETAQVAVHAGHGTANHSLAMPGVDGYLSRLTAPHSQHPLYCAFVGSSGGPPVPVPTPRFALLGATFMQTYIIKQVLNHTAEEAAQICFASSNGCGERLGQGEQPMPFRHGLSVA